MTRIKFCGLMKEADIAAANALQVDYAGFVFAPGSSRYLSVKKAEALKKLLSPGIRAVGVFVNEDPYIVQELLEKGLIDIAQLHGNEEDTYIKTLQKLTGKPVIKAFRIEGEEDCRAAEASAADLVLLDSGAGGTGQSFNWDCIRNFQRPYLLAGGLDSGNIRQAVELLHPFGVDVSSGIETDGKKDRIKMERFAGAVREAGAGKGEEK